MPTVKIEGLSKALDKIFKDNKKITVAGANRALRATVVKNWGDIIKSTPVDEGRARGGWFVTSGAPSTIADNRAKKTKGPAFVLSKTNKDMFGTKWFLTNNLPYILPLEFGGYGTKSASESGSKVTAQGFSKQAPQGFVRINLARFPSQLARAFKGAF
jgi:hypothetical protein